MDNLVQMNDFSNGWSWFIAIVVILGIIYCAALVWFNNSGSKEAKNEVMDTVWDEDLAEYNNPLPRWWLKMYYFFIVFGLIYLILYPGLGAYQGLLGWTQRGAYEQELAQAKEKVAPLYEEYGKLSVEELMDNPYARKTASRIFSTNCAICHGSAGKGAKGFPDLRDQDWLYGSSYEHIEETITKGRNGMMPAWIDIIGSDGSKDVTAYVISLSRESNHPDLLSKGKQIYEASCIACHGADAKGGQAMGAPNLTDNIWLYGGSEEDVLETILYGRHGHMPAQKDVMDKEQIRLLAAYVYRFVKEAEAAASSE
jgi:cytochrome c oxidase cbb3-type subunit 3